MKILTGNQLNELDRFTIENEPVTSIDLMDRAALAIAEWIGRNIPAEKELFFLIGKGNNGGDGLAAARILSENGYRCSVVTLFPYSELSEECRVNFGRLPDKIAVIENSDMLIPDNAVIIDALLGTGFRGELREPLSSFIDTINTLPHPVISIDLPSGMKSEYGNAEQKIIKAGVTLTLQFPKLAMLLPEVGEYCGNIEVLPIGLDAKFMQEAETPYHYVTGGFMDAIKLPRSKFAHKNRYGHALLVCGSKTMIGAALLAAGAALRSGCGLLTLHVPESERRAAQVFCPPALLSLDKASHFSELPSGLSNYSAIGIGCGLGQHKATEKALTKLLETVKQPVVLDADALNSIARNRELQELIPPFSILTPHLGELRRLTGSWNSEEQKLEKVRTLAARLQSIIIVKGSHTMICTNDGRFYFNSTGNSGMAKAGSGDVLTGLITGLLARGYSSEHAALSGVYYHGLAGDKAAEIFGRESMNSRDLIDCIQI
jgi:NAD(P)H-hydrate epimerase